MYSTAGAGKIFHPNVCDGAAVGEQGAAWSEPYYHAPCISLGSIYDGGCYEDYPFAPKVLPQGKITSIFANDSNATTQEVVEEEMSDGMIAAHAVQMLQRFANQSAPFFLAVGFHKCVSNLPLMLTIKVFM